MRGKKLNLFIIITIFITLLGISTNLEAKDIEVYIDLEKIDFDVEPMLYEGRTMVPMRRIFEKIGAEIDWDNKTRTVTSIKDGKKLELTIDDRFIILDGQKKEIDVAPILKDGRTLVPLRLVSETYGYDVEWLHSKKQVQIYSDKAEFTDGVLENGDLKIGIGMSEANLIKKMGEPKRVDPKFGGVDVYSFNNEEDTYKDYLQVELYKGNVVGIQTNAPNWSYNGISPGDDLSKPISIDNMLIEKEEYSSLIGPDMLDSKVTIIYIYSNEPIKPVEYDRVEELRGMERQIFDYINVLRIRNNRKPLKWSDEIAEFSRNYSQYFYDNMYEKPIGDLEDYFIEQLNIFVKNENLVTYKESIIMRYPGVFNIVFNWYNEPRHRATILREDLELLGIGGAEEDIFTLLFGSKGK